MEETVLHLMLLLYTQFYRFHLNCLVVPIYRLTLNGRKCIVLKLIEFHSFLPINSNANRSQINILRKQRDIVYVIELYQWNNISFSCDCIISLS